MTTIMITKNTFTLFLIWLITYGVNCCESKLEVVAYPEAQEEYQLAIGDTLRFSTADNRSIPHFSDWINKDSVSVVRLVGSEYNDYPENEDCLGCRGYRNWEFVAVKSGTEVLNISLVPFVEGDDPIEDNEDLIKITVR